MGVTGLRHEAHIGVSGRSGRATRTACVSLAKDASEQVSPRRTPHDSQENLQTTSQENLQRRYLL